jgi:hypothetical protein
MAWSDPLAHSLAALADVRDNGAGERYLIQHSAGSGKSNSITWLSHQLIGVKRSAKEVFDSAIVVTDARILDARFGRRSSPSCRSSRPLDLPSIPAIFVIHRMPGVVNLMGRVPTSKGKPIGYKKF